MLPRHELVLERGVVETAVRLALAFALAFAGWSSNRLGTRGFSV